MIPIYKPYLPSASLRFAHEAIDSTWISSRGKYIPLLREKLQELLGVKYVLPLNNGTSACHLLAKALHAKYNVNHIIVPNNVYAAAWNAFLFDNQYVMTPVDADLNTWNVDLDSLDQAIKRNPKAAVLVVHNVGNIINVAELQRSYPETVFVEDNCEGFLGTYDGRYTGTASFASAVSFFGNKNITSGEGGAFITNDEETYHYANCIQNQGQSERRFVHDELGYNYRMTNIQAALLYGQLEVLPEIMDMKTIVFRRYWEALKDREDIVYQTEEYNTQHSMWMFGIRIPGHANYEQTEAFFKQQGIEIRPMFYAIDEHKHIRHRVSGVYHIAKQLNRECIILPSYPELTREEQQHILCTLDTYVRTQL